MFRFYVLFAIYDDRICNFCFQALENARYAFTDLINVQ